MFDHRCLTMQSALSQHCSQFSNQQVLAGVRRYQLRALLLLLHAAAAASCNSVASIVVAIET